MKKVILIVLNIILLLSVIFFSIFISPYEDHLGLDIKIIDYDALLVLKVVWILILGLTGLGFILTEHKKHWLIWYAILTAYSVYKIVFLFFFVR